MWGDEKFRRLSAPCPCGQSLWIYLLTGPHTTSLPGLFNIGEAALAEALGWTLKAFREAFAEAHSQGMVKADWQARVVWIPRAIEYNFPESPNVVKGWRAAWDEMPECQLKTEAYHLFRQALKAKKAFAEAFAEAIGEGGAPRESRINVQPKRNQEQEQEQDLPLNPQTTSGESGAMGNPSPPPPPEAVLTFPTQGRAKTWGLTPEYVAELQALYPGLDVSAECHKAFGWVRADPQRRKTAKGMPKFLVNWLNRATERQPAGRAPPANGRPPPSKSFADRFRDADSRINMRQEPCPPTGTPPGPSDTPPSSG
jgi:hypothetical protein